MCISVNVNNPIVELIVRGNPHVSSITKRVIGLLKQSGDSVSFTFLINLLNSTENRSYSEILHMVESLRPYFHQMSCFHVFLVRQDLHYGVARMFASFAESHGLKIRVFRDRNQANNWLMENLSLR